MIWNFLVTVSAFSLSSHNGFYVCSSIGREKNRDFKNS